MDTWVVSTCRLLWIKYAINICATIFQKHLFPCLSEKGEITGTLKHLRTYQNLFVTLHIFKTNAWGFQVFHILAKLVFWITAVLILLLMSSSLIASLISHFQILTSHLYIFFRRSIYLDPLCLCFLKKKNWVLLIALSFCVDSK